MGKTTQNNSLEFSLLLFAVIISLIFFDSKLLFPIKIFIIIFHEINHVFAGIISGGEPKYLTFDLNLSGKTLIEGGSQIFIASAGYLGSIVIGSLLFVSSFSNRFRKWYLNILAIIIFLTTVNLIKGELQIFIGLLVSVTLFLISKYLPENILKFFLQYVGLISCLYVITDIKEDLLIKNIRVTDTQILEYLTGVSAQIWGIIWLFIALGVFGFLLKFYFGKIKN